MNVITILGLICDPSFSLIPAVNPPTSTEVVLETEPASLYFLTSLLPTPTHLSQKLVQWPSNWTPSISSCLPNFQPAASAVLKNIDQLLSSHCLKPAIDFMGLSSQLEPHLHSLLGSTISPSVPSLPFLCQHSAPYIPGHPQQSPFSPLNLPEGVCMCCSP